MGFPGGDLGTLVTIGGDTTGLVAAVGMAVDALGTLDASMADSAATTADLAAATADTAGSFADIAAAAGDASAMMADLAAGAADASGGMMELAAGSADASGALADVGAAAEAAQSSMVAGSASMGEMVGVMGMAEGGAGLLVDGLQSLGTGILGVAQQAAMFITVLAGWQIIQTVSGWVENLITQMFQLDEQTQKTVNSWQYLFQSKAGATSLAGWAYKESPNLPFTAMDLRAAISTLGTAGYSPGQIEQFIPYLADIASTLGTAAYGGQGVTLNQAAMAIRSAGFGLTRMLRTDLGVSPQQLVPYGLDASVGRGGAVKIHNMATLLPALMAFARGRGLAGAAQEQETATFWGGYSSFQDYAQNFLQTVGGIDPRTGDVTPGSMFGGIQNILNSINAALGGPEGINASTGGGLPAGIKGPGARRDVILEMQQHAMTATPTLRDLANVLERVLGGAVTSLTNAFSGLFAGMGAGGAGGIIMTLYNDLKDFGDWLNSAPIQADIRKVAGAIGELLGQGLKEAKNTLPMLGTAFKDLGNAAAKLWGDFTPDQQKGITDFLGTMATSVLPGAIIGVANAIEGLAGAFQYLANQIPRLMQLLGHVGDFLGAAGGFMQLLDGTNPAVAKWAGDLIHNFQTWAGDMLQGFAQGIENAIPGVLGKFLDLGQKIANLFGFSVPKEGPLASAASWMPDFINLLANGIRTGVPELAGAMGQAAEGMFSQFFRTMGAWANYLADQMFNWGRDFIRMLANGITSGIGFVMTAANQAAAILASMWRHSAPTEGPLVGDSEWGLHFMQQLAGGMDRGLPYVAEATNRAAAALGGPLGPAIGPLGGQFGGSSTSNTWNNTLGGNATSIVLYGASPITIQQIIKQMLLTNDQQMRLTQLAPGGFQQFGAFG